MQYLEHSIEEYIEVQIKRGIDFYTVVADLATQMFESIQQMHEIGYIHRDIKPENFRVDKGKVYITDFGTINQVRDEEGKMLVSD